ncbi:MAG: YeeE/YedE family protein [Myxococcales bacterium]|nr:YeeE/YedE family protein [Myxococcales bacterium]
MSQIKEKPLWNPYIAGVALGLVLLAAFLVLGHGIGASGASSRLGVFLMNGVSESHVHASQYFARYFAAGSHVLNDWLVFMVIGIFGGGLVSSVLGGRNKSEIVKGPRVGVGWRLIAALSGGILMGFAARLARGCTSGQALSGGALLSVGSWIFMLAVFAGGYAVAALVRRQWQ